MPKRKLAAAARGLPHASPRLVVEVAILQLIDLLDELDADPDLEDDDREEDKSDFEPSLGSAGAFDQESWAQGLPWALDAELDDSDREPDVDDEPSLAAPVGNGDQRRWAQGDDSDLEATFADDDRQTVNVCHCNHYELVTERRALERQVIALAARIRGRAVAAPSRHEIIIGPDGRKYAIARCG